MKPDTVPTIVTTSIKDAQSGQWVRSFSGRAAPPEALFDATTGQTVRIRTLFPNRNDPFAINDRLELGPTGYNLKTIDRARSGIVPGDADQPWALNMIPFGVLVDGSILDPSGPWYDGGRPDPNNPFDRNCTGWEYEVTYPTVADLVGLPAAFAGHVQPSGMFHYHGYPTLLIENLRAAATPRAGSAEALVVGYSADGFPVIDYRTLPSAEGRQDYFFSGYLLRPGQRAALDLTNPAYVPPGAHDGLYVQDYIYDPMQKKAQIEQALRTTGHYFGLRRGDLEAGKAQYAVLDLRNGAIADGRYALADYQAKTYHYVITPDWPMIPRLFAFEPDDSFKHVIPFAREPSREGVLRKLLSGIGFGGSQGRKELYDACTGDLKRIREWQGRKPY